MAPIATGWSQVYAVPVITLDNIVVLVHVLLDANCSVHFTLSLSGRLSVQLFDTVTHVCVCINLRIKACVRVCVRAWTVNRPSTRNLAQLSLSVMPYDMFGRLNVQTHATWHSFPYYSGSDTKFCTVRLFDSCDSRTPC